MLSPQQGERRAGPHLLQGPARTSSLLSQAFFKSCSARGLQCRPFHDGLVVSLEPFLLTSLPSTHGWASGDHLPLDVAEHLSMAQEAAKIYVEHVAGGLQHDIIIVPVTDAQDICGHAAASTGIDEVLHSLGGRQADGRRGQKGTPRATARLNSASPALSLLSPNSTSCLPVQPSSLTHTETSLLSYGLYGDGRLHVYLHHFICNSASSAPFFLPEKSVGKTVNLSGSPDLPSPD